MGQRQWILLRHGNAEAESASGKDQDRALSAHGQDEARSAAQWLQSRLKGHSVRLMSSSASRALATAGPVAEALGVQVELEPDIYDATPGRLMAILNERGNEGVTVLVGHNPGLEQTVALLGEGRTDEYRGMPTGSVAWFDVPEDMVEPGNGRLTAFWRP